MAETYPGDERLRILRMVEEGKISAQDAIGLLYALAGASKPAPEAQAISIPATPATPPVAEVSPQNDQSWSSKGKFRFFRVRVTDAKSGRPKALVTIPIGLMEWGLKIGAQFSPEVSKINIEDFNQLMEAGIDGKLIDVMDDEDGEHVEIFVE